MIIIGDTHSVRKVYTLIEDSGRQETNFIHVGDFGLGFQDLKKDIHNLLLLDSMLSDLDNHLYVIRGNHDFKAFWNKGVELPEFTHLHLMDDYSTEIIEKKKVLFVGGAISIDRTARFHDNSWDINEEFVLDEEKAQAIEDIDVVITHSSPLFCPPYGWNDLVDYYHNEERKITGKDLKEELLVEREKLSRLFDILKEKNNIDVWYYGHFHSHLEHEEDNTKFVGLAINELNELNYESKY